MRNWLHEFLGEWERYVDLTAYIRRDRRIYGVWSMGWRLLVSSTYNDTNGNSE